MYRVMTRDDVQVNDHVSDESMALDLFLERFSEEKDNCVNENDLVVRLKVCSSEELNPMGVLEEWPTVGRTEMIGNPLPSVLYKYGMFSQTSFAHAKDLFFFLFSAE